MLGSGFAQAATRMAIDATLPYDRIPGFPRTQVQGHRGNLHIGRLGGTPILILSGRSHFYEGHSMEEITFPIRVLACYGITDLLLTNAAGGINRNFRAGDFMSICDHINFMGVNPLRSNIAETPPQFLDLSAVYDSRLRKLLKTAASRGRVLLREGIYLAVSGPTYETPAEIVAFRRLGADAVGMSTVPEAIVARACNIRVAGLSCISNLAAGMTRNPISHDEVLDIASLNQARACALLEQFAKLYGRGPRALRTTKTVAAMKTKTDVDGSGTAAIVPT